MATLLDGSTVLAELATHSASGMVSAAYLEELRAAVSIVDLLENEYDVILEASSTGWYQACCPLPGHHDTVPSFGANPEKGIFNCFACGKKGDIFELIRYMEGISFREAVVKLGVIAGLTETEDAAEIGRAIREIAALAADYTDRCAQTPLPGGLSEAQMFFLLAQSLREYERRVHADALEIGWVDSIYAEADALEVAGDLRALARLWDTLGARLRDRLAKRQSQEENEKC